MKDVKKQITEIEKQLRSSIAVIIADLVNDSSSFYESKIKELKKERDDWKQKATDLSIELEVLKRNMK
jgi:uncharacterized coiled-coil DUF342 family protein